MVLNNDSPLFLDKLLILFLYCLAILPFAQVFHVNIGFAIFDAYEFLLFLLFFSFIAIIVKRGIAKEHATYVFFVITLFVAYSCFSFIFLNIDFSSWINQTRNYFPFIVACMALLARLHIDKFKFLNQLTLAVTISAFLAILIHLLFKDFIAYSLSSSNELKRVILEGGRLYWGGSILAFFSLAAFMIEKNKYKKQLLGFSVFIIILGAVFTQNRTVIAGFAIFFIACQLFVFKRFIRPIIYISVIIAAISVGFIFLASDGMVSLLQKRLFLTEAASAEFERAFIFGRIGLYTQYLDRLISSFPFGQGLGFPFSYNLISSEPIFTSDISLITFALPFGLIGIAMFLVFVAKNFNVFNRYKKKFPSDISPKIFNWLLFTVFLISLNIDVFSRNIFVVYLSVFAVLHYIPSTQAMDNGIS